MSGGRPSKTIKWTKEQTPDSIQIKEGQKIYTCVIDKIGRPSSIGEAVQGQKCIVILLD